jgi:hypothetical protein
MIRPSILTLALGMMFATFAHAAWIPTGRTDFVAPATVQGRPGDTVGLQAQLLYELKDTAHPAKRQWQPLPSATVNFYVKGAGIQGQDTCPQGHTNGRGVAKSSWTIPNPAKAKHYTYTVVYAGGRKDGVMLDRRSENGSVDVIK